MTREDYERAGCRVLMQDGVPLVEGVKAAPAPPEMTKEALRLEKAFRVQGGLLPTESLREKREHWATPAAKQGPFWQFDRRMKGVR